MSIYRGFDQAELDREYSPSSCIEDIDVYLGAYARSSRRAKDAALSEGSCLSDLAYGPSPDERLDLFLPDAASGGPLQVYIHGGYWQALSKDDSSFAAPMFQRHGSYFAALDYSLAPRATLKEIVEQNRRAIAWLAGQASEWGFDGDRLHLSGSSAGAHLVMMMLLTDWSGYALPRNLVKGACAVSGIYDLEPIRLSYVNEPLDLSRRDAEQLSPHGRKLNNRCPVILAYGDNETSEFKRQTDEYATALRVAGEHVSLRQIEGRNHFDVIMDLMDPSSWLAQQVLAQMGLSPG